MQPTLCRLCELTGSPHPVLDTILAHVSDNAHQVHISELCAQVQPILADRLQIHMSTAELEQHFLRHRCEQRVVLSSIIRDLLEIKSDRAQLELSGIRRRQGRSGHELPTVDLKLPHHRRTGYNLPKRADSEVNFRAYFTQEFSAVAAR